MFRLLAALVFAGVAFAVSVAPTYANEYAVSVLVDGKPVTLTLSIADTGAVTLTSPISQIVVSQITPIRLRGGGDWAAREPEALAGMDTQEDTFNNVTFYTDPRVNLLGRDHIYSYIGTQGDKAWLRIYLYYLGKDWLFIEKYIVMADGQRWEITPKIGEVERDNGTYAIWEWVDLYADPEHVQMLAAIADADKAMIRYQGDQRNLDREISAEEKAIIATTLAAFEQLGGKVAN